jgi:hypothetical protein
MRVEADDLREPVIIYMASSLGLARAVEALLNSQGIDYVVQVEDLGRSTLFGSRRHGAAFYVSSNQAAWCRDLLRQADLANGIVED